MENEPPSETSEPLFIIAPENFRGTIQRQIATHVAKEIDNLTSISLSGKRNTDGRFGTALAKEVVAMSDSNGFPYFVVGASPVGEIYVAAP
jgi:hypothetical protein